MMSTPSEPTHPQRGAVAPGAPAAKAGPRVVKRKTRITIYLDDEVLRQFRTLSEQCGQGYQTLINAALRSGLDTSGQTG